MVAYIAVAFFVFVEFRYWLPIVFPVGGAMLIEHIMLVTYRVVFEEREQRRVKSIFSKIVSPNVVNELLQAKRLSLGGARREVTVFFADVRGFTTFTDERQQRVAEFVSQHRLDAAAAEKCFDESARETLETVNLYLAAVADAVKKHDGTLDKYIGDCVMAFWGAPTPNERHALACVRAAIDAQRGINALNQKRLEENASQEIENRIRISAGLPSKPLLPALQLGIGINTGLVNVGLMGSDAHILNYTVFGREVNLASRLEGVSGGGRIIISYTTYNQLLRDDPALASTCIEMSPVSSKVSAPPCAFTKCRGGKTNRFEFSIFNFKLKRATANAPSANKIKTKQQCERRFIPAVLIRSPTAIWTWFSARPNCSTASSWPWRKMRANRRCSRSTSGWRW